MQPPRLLAPLALVAVVLAPLAASAQNARAGGVNGRPLVLSAEAVFLLDPDGRALYAKNPAEDRAPASLVKLMTLYLAYDDLEAGRADPDEPVLISANAAQTPRYRMGLRAGDRVLLRTLLEGVAIASANDAATALAEYVGGGSVDRFVELMNAKARVLGLRDTHFVNPSGLDAPGHYSSARDVTKLARIAMRKPMVRRTVRLATARAAGRTLTTWDDLLGRFPGLIGVKTGHTDDAGWSQVAAARGPGLTVYATILGSPTRAKRNADLTALLSWGLSRYRVVDAIDTRRTYATATAGYGRAPVRLVAAAPLRRSVRIGRPLVERVVAPTVVALPVRKGQHFGSVRVYVRGRLLGERPLVAAASRSAPGLGGKIRWYATRTLHNALGVLTP